MNERHTELADIVANMMPGVYSIKYESGKKGIEFTEEAFEKFAELIVRECCNRSYMEDSSNSEVEEALEFWRNNIKQHFGVKE